MLSGRAILCLGRAIGSCHVVPGAKLSGHAMPEPLGKQPSPARDGPSRAEPGRAKAVDSRVKP